MTPPPAVSDERKENMSDRATHTPGPWTVEIGMDALVRCPDGRTFNAGDAIYHDDNKANARLIAVAPEFLSALREIAAVPCGVPGHSVAVGCRAASIARAALAKMASR